eukprot:g4179.t1
MFDFRSFAEESTKQSVGFYEQRDALAAIRYVRESFGQKPSSSSSSSSKGEVVVEKEPVRSPERPIRVGLFGASMGGAVALLVSHGKRAEQVDAVVTDCAFASLRGVVRHGMRFTFPYMPETLLRFSETCLENFNLFWFGYSLDDVNPVEAVRGESQRSKLKEGDQDEIEESGVAPRTSAALPPMLIIHSENDEVVPIEHGKALYANAACPNRDCEFWIVPDTHHIGAYFETPMEYNRRVVGFFDRAFSCPEAGKPRAS